jgi:serine/threonine protein kinase
MIYTVIEIPILNQNRKNLKAMIDAWKSKLVISSHFLAIHKVFWNSPEGYLSLISDHMNGGTLKELGDYSGGVPENVLKDIACQIIDGLAVLHQENMTHSSISS